MFISVAWNTSTAAFLAYKAALILGNRDGDVKGELECEDVGGDDDGARVGVRISFAGMRSVGGRPAKTR